MLASAGIGAVIAATFASQLRNRIGSRAAFLWIENRGAAISTCVIGVEWLAEQKGEPTPDVADALYSCADRLMAATGRIDPLWGDVNRHVRGDLNLPVGGGPDTLRKS